MKLDLGAGPVKRKIESGSCTRRSFQTGTCR